MQADPDDLIEIDEEGWQVFPEAPLMNRNRLPMVAPESNKRVETGLGSAGSHRDYPKSSNALTNPDDLIEVDEDGWQVFPVIGAISKPITESAPPDKVRGDKVVVRPQEPPKSSNGTVGSAINAIRREWWNTPPPPSTSTVTSTPGSSAVSIPIVKLPSPSRPLATLPPSKQTKPTSVIDPAWELIDPNPDVHALFMLFNSTYFWDKLGAVTVEWSSRMTTCAGLCYFKRVNHLSECSIKLSLPLLKLRPRKDLVETLLHEMIHAYLFLEPVRGASHDRDGHGPNFQDHMHRINRTSGAHITIYHSFHDEVGHYKQHWWQCNGPCRFRHPFFGLVKRAMNRAPGPNDRWWSEHAGNCNGVFIKVREPPKADKENKKRAPTATATSWSDS